jgi:hypothetical protein
MQAKALAMIRIQQVYTIEKQIIAEVTCHDYDEYRSLPDAIELDNKIMGKTGWSSDKCYACYKTGVLLGKIIDVYG